MQRRTARRQTRAVLCAVAPLVLALAVPGCALPTTRHAPTVITIPDAGAIVPLEWTGGDFIARVRIDGSDELRFLFDTGSSLCVVAPSQLRHLALETTSAPRYVRGAGESRWAMVRKGTIDDFVVTADGGALRLQQLDFWALPLPGPYAGLFGLSVFGDLMVTLDGPARRLRCAEGSLPPPDHGEILPYQLINGVPVVRIQLAGREIPVAVDTGFDGHISIPAALADDLPLSVAGRDVVYHTVHGTWKERIHLLEGEMRIGQHVLESPPVLVGAGTARIGTKILHRFAVTFDQRAKRMRFRAAPADLTWRPAPLVAPLTLPE